jgi:DNA-binding SARP family transcriptional activator/tetratricopeptide (TPR) repeat protein
VFFRVLGPVELLERGQSLSAGSLKEQCVLAILLFEGGRAVSAQSLAERLWDDQLPDKARETLQVYISRLRRRLRSAGDSVGVIKSSPAGGYRLDVAAHEVDVRRFDDLLVQARAAASQPHPERARELLVQAESLWSGEPLEGLSGQWAQATRQALQERRRGAMLARIDLDLRLGRPSDELISELIALAGSGRIDQKLTGLLMRALHGAGRQDEALAAFRQVRGRLRRELGVDPSAELEKLHRRILQGDPTLASAGPAESAVEGPAPYTLDRDPAFLTGREEQSRGMLAAITADLRSASGIAVYALDGMAGIGKTALAVHAAHRLAEQCPDGAVQINLHAHDPHQPAVDARAALVQLLEVTGVRAGDVGRAGTVDALAALWRRRSSGRRMLILLDDVLDVEQVAPLLPVTAGNVVLLTSRRRLLGLHAARHHTVHPLADEATVRLLERISGWQYDGDHLALERFSRHCAGLPLAATVAAAYLRARPSWTLRDLVERLATSSHADGEDQLVGPVRAAFTMSYRALSPPHQALLRRVAAQPGHDFGLHAAAALADASPERTDLVLDTLIDHHLLDEVGRHRYRLHDLLRAFAIDQVRQEHDGAETTAAIDRMIEFYAATAARAERALRPYRRNADHALASSMRGDRGVDDPAAAQTWLDRESANLIAVATYALAQPGNLHATVLPCTLAQHLDRRGRWGEAVGLLRRALEIESDSDPAGALAAQLGTDLAEAYVRAEDLDHALECATAALKAWSARHDVRGQADALLELGRVHWLARRPAEAADALGRSAQAYQQVGDVRGQAVADYHRGIVVFESGRQHEALALTHDALRSASSLGIAALECDLLTNLGEMYRLTERHEQALEYFERAQRLADRQGDPHNIAVLANNIAAVHNERGDHAAALVSSGTALRLFRALGDRRNEIDTLLQMAEALRHTGDRRRAAIEISRAAELADLIHDPLRHSQIRLVEGHLHRDGGRHHEATQSYEMALAAAEAAGAPLDQAHAHQALGRTLADLDDASSARLHLDHAQRLYHQSGRRGDGA